MNQLIESGQPRYCLALPPDELEDIILGIYESVIKCADQLSVNQPFPIHIPTLSAMLETDNYHAPLDQLAAWEAFGCELEEIVIGEADEDEWYKATGTQQMYLEQDIETYMYHYRLSFAVNLHRNLFWNFPLIGVW